MGMIQSAINSAIGSATAGVGIAKGIKAVEDKKATDEGNRQVQMGQTLEKIAGLETELKSDKSNLKQGKDTLKMAREGFQMIDLDGHQLKVPISGQEQKDLIKQQLSANRTMAQIVQARKFQIAGHKIKYETLKGGKK